MFNCLLCNVCFMYCLLACMCLCTVVRSVVCVGRKAKRRRRGSSDSPATKGSVYVCLCLSILVCVHRCVMSVRRLCPFVCPQVSVCLYLCLYVSFFRCCMCMLGPRAPGTRRSSLCFTHTSLTHTAYKTDSGRHVCLLLPQIQTCLCGSLCSLYMSVCLHVFL